MKNGYTTLEVHMPAKHLFYQESKGWDADNSLSRAERIGPETQRVVGVVLEKRQFREQNLKSYLGILKLADKYTPQRLEAACLRLHGTAEQHRKIPLVILDDFGLAPMEDNTRLAMMQLPEDRYGRKSTIIVSQLPLAN